MPAALTWKDGKLVPGNAAPAASPSPAGVWQMIDGKLVKATAAAAPTVHKPPPFVAAAPVSTSAPLTEPVMRGRPAPPTGSVTVWFGTESGTAEGFARTLVAEGHSRNPALGMQVCDLKDWSFAGTVTMPVQFESAAHLTVFICLRWQLWLRQVCQSSSSRALATGSQRTTQHASTRCVSSAWTGAWPRSLIFDCSEARQHLTHG